MILDKITFLRFLTPDGRAAQKLGKRWSAAATREPELVADVLRMGGVLAQRPRAFVDGIETAEPIDPTRLAIEQGRRELALELIACMSVTPYELAQLIEENIDVD